MHLEGIKLNNQNFQGLYDDYTQMMLFTSSNKLKLENIHEEVFEIQKSYNEAIEEYNDQKSILTSLNGLKSRLGMLQDEVEAVLDKFDKISDMLRQIDIMISDYYEMDIEIDLYELNGMEKDLFGVKDEYIKYKDLKLMIDTLKKEIDDKIIELS